jgi:hypothetical protein
LPGGRAATVPSPGDVDRFLLEILAERAPDTYRTVEMLLAEGVELDDLCLGLLGPAASRLGQLWSDDRCDFTTVTVALGGCTASCGSWAQPSTHRCPPPPSRRARCLRSRRRNSTSSGWRWWRSSCAVTAGTSSAEWAARSPTPAPRVREDAVDIVGLSIGSDDRLDWLHETVHRVRAMSINRDVKVLVGGAGLRRPPGVGGGSRRRRHRARRTRSRGTGARAGRGQDVFNGTGGPDA